jgi:NDP-sugar pyrophosphorylase family protein
MGVYAMSRRAVEAIPADVPFGFDQLMLKLIEQNQKPHVFAHKGEWLDIGRTEDYDLAQTKYADFGRKPQAADVRLFELYK